MLQPDPALEPATNRPFVEPQSDLHTSHTGSSTRLIGRRRRLAQILCGVLILIAVVSTIATLPAYFEIVRTPLADSGFILRFWQPRQLYTSDLAALSQIGLTLDAYAAYLTTIWVICITMMLGASALIFWRRPDDKMALYASLMLGLFAIFNIGSPTSVLFQSQSAPLLLFYMVMIDITAIIALALCFVFPDGRFVPGWTRWLTLGWIVLTVLTDFVLPSEFRMDNWPPLVYLINLNVVYGIGVYAQIYRFRHVATAVQRQQTKWVLYGYMVIYALTIGVSLLATVFIPAIEQPGLTHVLYNIVGQFLFVVGIVWWGWSLAISALRYRLWDVDLVINRSLVYGALTVLLALVFGASVFVIRQLILLFINTADSSIAFAASAVLIGALFQPVRRRLQHLVDRRFYHLLINLDRRSHNQGQISRTDALSGVQLGAYEVHDPIGSGAMGEVYEGVQKALKRPVAIKVMSRHLADKSEFRARFEREARTAAMLSHPNIVHVFDFGQFEGMYYMVMDYIEGQSLSAVLQGATRLSLIEAQTLVKGVASALDYAHSKGIVHRDVKPSNIMLCPSKSRGTGPDWQPVLMDFGIAKIIGSTTGITGTGVVGTLDYLAPEQINAAHAVDHRADIYALGVILFEALTGELPFKGDNPAQVVYAHLNKPAPDPREIVPALTIGATYVIQRAMSTHPENRFDSAGAMAAALQ